MKKVILIIVAVLIAGLLAGGYYLYKERSKKDPSALGTSRKKSEESAKAFSAQTRKMSEFYFAQGGYQTVISTYQNMLATSPDNAAIKKTLAETYAGLAELEIKYGRKIDAKKSIETAIKLDPENKKALELKKGM